MTGRDPRNIVELVIVDAGHKSINVIKEVRAISGVGLAEAKVMIAPGAGPIFTGQAVEATKFKAKLEEAGAKVLLRPASSNQADAAFTRNVKTPTFKRFVEQLLSALVAKSLPGTAGFVPADQAARIAELQYEPGWIRSGIEALKSRGLVEARVLPGGDDSTVMARLTGEGLLEAESIISVSGGVPGETLISTTPGKGPAIVFRPSVFEVPTQPINPLLVSVMMPFAGNFTGTYEAIKGASTAVGLECSRADDIWEHSVVIQDVFSLIFRSFIVVCDFTGRNPNVFYEAGIAHTLGKHVVPITQSQDDIPFDLRHHRYVHYLNNTEGRQKLKGDLEGRFRFLFNQLRVDGGVPNMTSSSVRLRAKCIDESAKESDPFILRCRLEHGKIVGPFPLSGTLAFGGEPWSYRLDPVGRLTFPEDEADEWETDILGKSINVGTEFWLASIVAAKRWTYCVTGLEEADGGSNK